MWRTRQIPNPPRRALKLHKLPRDVHPQVISRTKESCDLEALESRHTGSRLTPSALGWMERIKPLGDRSGRKTARFATLTRRGPRILPCGHRCNGEPAAALIAPVSLHLYRSNDPWESNSLRAGDHGFSGNSSLFVSCDRSVPTREKEPRCGCREMSEGVATTARPTHLRRVTRILTRGDFERISRLPQRSRDARRSPRNAAPAAHPELRMNSSVFRRRACKRHWRIQTAGKSACTPHNFAGSMIRCFSAILRIPKDIGVTLTR